DGGNAKREAKRLQDEGKCARELGFDVEYEDVGPVNRLPALRFADQMQFHPLRYVSALARIAASKGVRIFEHTEAESFESNCAMAEGHRIEFNDVVIATHV